MQVTFYGVRGSVPAPGPHTVRYGGNTSCVEVRLSDESTVVLDAGTGMRALGNALIKQGLSTPVHLLLSHTHWDHVLGLPFFAPLYRSDTHLFVYPLANEAQELFQQNIFNDIHFPVSVDDIPARLELARPEKEEWRIGSAIVRRVELNHPGGAQGFRIDDDDGTSVAYLTDNELSAQNAKTSIEGLARFADGVDLLIHDSQYLAEDMPAKLGWGHSIVTEVLRLGVLAEPRQLALFHHDPDRSDTALDLIGQTSQSFMKSEGKATQVMVASEGLAVHLKR
jgi:phosphoribosyl 1,2-cyclic phosphodiesterase